MKMTKATAKVAAVATGLAMATSMLSLAPIAHAATLTTAQVSSILSLLSSFGANSATIANVNAALTGTTVTSGSTTTTSGASSCSFSRSLTIGSTGADVTCLQGALIAGGFSIPAGATGYFGTQTRTAVASWQSSRNVAPAVGYFGPISQAAWNLGGSSSSSSTTTTTTTTTSTVAGCAAGAAFSATTGAACGTTTTTTALTGSGRLTNVSSLSDTTSDIKPGDAATNVAGFSAVATGGDVAIQRVDVHFDIGGSGSSNIDQYVSDVSLWLDGKKIANMDPALGDKSSGGIWDLRFSGLNGVIRSGQTGNLYVKVTPLTSINSTNNGAIAVSFATDSVRAVGADGISDTYSPLATGSFTVTAATTGTLVASLASDNPASGIVATASSTTTGVKLLSFNLKAKNSAVTITDLGASVGVSAGNTIAGVVSNVKLMGPNGYSKTGTINGTGTYSTVTFSGVDRTIARDATEGYWISVDLKNDSGYVDGSTIIASTTVLSTTGSSLWDISDASGNTVTPPAAVVGNSQSLIGTGIVTATLVGTPTATYVQRSAAGAAVDHVNAVISFSLAADSSSDIYVDSTLLLGTTVLSSSGGFSYATTSDSTTGTTTSATLASSDTNTGDAIAGSGGTSPYFKISAGTARTFTLTVSIADGLGALQTGAAGLRILGFNYGATAATMTSVYNYNLGAFKTPTVPGLGAN